MGSEVTTINLEGITCACGCGMEATQFYRGVPIPDTNPMTHFRTYLARENSEQARLRERMVMGSQARRFILDVNQEEEVRYGES